MIRVVGHDPDEAVPHRKLKFDLPHGSIKLDRGPAATSSRSRDEASPTRHGAAPGSRCLVAFAIS